MRMGIADPAVEYRCVAIEQLRPFGDLFDVVVSSLALHYVEDYEGAMARIAAVMRPGGWLVLSVEHPMMTALPGPQWHRDIDGSPLH